MKKGVFVAVLAAVGCLSAGAAADEVPKRKPKVIVTEPVEIVARQRPVVAVDVQRIRPRLGVRDLKRSVLDNIESAAGREPF